MHCCNRTRPFTLLAAHPRRGALIGVVALFLACAQPFAQGFVRPFPPNALRGELVVTQAPEVAINGIGYRLAPGARIRGANNMLVMPAAIAGQSHIVNFTTGAQGLVQEVWILTDAERMEKRQGAEGSAGNFRFESESSRAPRDDGKTPFNQLPRFGQPGSRP